MREQLHHLFRGALELRTKVIALRTDADRAGVGMTLAHHDASHGDQRRGADAIFIGAKHRRHDDVAARLQTAVGAQHHLVAKVVHGQNLMHLGQAHLPGQTGMLDRGLRAGAGAAAMAGYQNGVGFCLGHTGSDRADAGRGDKLHTDFCVRIDLLQVIDQLCQILDRVDVMVWRWRNQGHTGGRVPQSCDQTVDLDPRKLATLAGLRALGHLDLDFLAAVQIFRGHAKPARGNLLDRARRVVAILAKLEACRILAAFAGIGFRTNAVHRDRQRLMRFGAEGAKRDAGRHKPLADAGDGFDILDLHRFASSLEIHQVAEVDRSLASDKRRVFFPAFIGAGVTGMLHRMDQLTVKGVTLTGPAIAEEAANRKDRIGCLEGFAVHVGDTGRDAGQAKAGNARRHGREIFRHKRTRQAKRLEVIATAIGGDDRNAHLRHDLQQAVLDRLAVVGDSVGKGQAGQQPTVMPLGNGFFGDIGIDGGRPDADQNREMMNIEALASGHIDRGKGAELLADKMRMHRACGQDHRDRTTCVGHTAIREHHMLASRTDGLFGLTRDPVQRGGKIIRPVSVEGAVDDRCLVTKIGQKRVPFRHRQHRRVQQQMVTLLRRLIQNVAKIAKPCAQRHHMALAKAVDRRVGHLREILPEEMMQAPIAVRQHRKRCVVTH